MNVHVEGLQLYSYDSEDDDDDSSFDIFKVKNRDARFDEKLYNKI